MPPGPQSKPGSENWGKPGEMPPNGLGRIASTGLGYLRTPLIVLADLL